MKLSDAIRLGSMMRPRGSGPSSIASSADAVCALGAACLAVGIEATDDERVYGEIAARFPIAAEPAPCPGAEWCNRRAEVMELIWHLNDSHDWSRERIADWVEQIETLESQISRVLSPGEEEQKELKAESLVAYGRTGRSDRG